MAVTALKQRGGSAGFTLTLQYISCFTQTDALPLNNQTLYHPRKDPFHMIDALGPCRSL